MRIGVISLGCAKNLVDTENLLGLLIASGQEIVRDYDEAEAIIINTCGFIESAKTEAIDTILEAADLKEDHPDEEMLRKLHEKSGLPLRKLFNTSGKLYRELELSKKLPEMSEDEMYRLLASDGMLVKRPMLVTKDKVLAGFKEEDWEETVLK